MSRSNQSQESDICSHFMQKLTGFQGLQTEIKIHLPFYLIAPPSHPAFNKHYHAQSFPLSWAYLKLSGPVAAF